VRLQRAGYSCHAYRQAQLVSWGHQQSSWELEVEGVARWLQSLPKPPGLTACNDFRATQTLDACRRAGIAVPEDVAVVGVDQEEFGLHARLSPALFGRAQRAEHRVRSSGPARPSHEG
jgi:DNA-binding LacI/PurR family transcriptional regulator